MRGFTCLPVVGVRYFPFRVVKAEASVKSVSKVQPKISLSSFVQG